MRYPLAVCVVLSMACLAASARDPRPAPHCADARQIRETWQSDERTLAIRLEGGERYRIELADACGGATTGEQPVLHTRSGRLCGSNEEILQVGERTCAVSGMAPIDAREFAEHALTAASLARVQTMDRVEVRGERMRTFVGTSAYCFAPKHVRGWNMDAEGMVVEVSPRRSGGNRYYRVELAGYCSELYESNEMQLESGMGLGAICGNAGDVAVPIVPLAGDTPTLAASASAFGTRRPPGSIVATECRVTRVYPIERG